MADKDKNQAAADKLNKEIQEVQAKQKAEFDKPRKNMPTENDMGPLPKKESEKPRKNMPTENDMGPLPKKELVKPVKKFAKGGTASSRADGCAVRGKTRA